MHVSIAQANFPKMYLEYFPISMLMFFSHVAFALEAFVHLYAAAKNVLFSTQSKKKSVNLGTEPVFIVPDTHSEHHLENVFLGLKLCLEQPETLTQNIFCFRVHCALCMYLGCSKCGGLHS